MSQTNALVRDRGLKVEEGRVNIKFSTLNEGWVEGWS